MFRILTVSLSYTRHYLPLDSITIFFYVEWLIYGSFLIPSMNFLCPILGCE